MHVFEEDGRAYVRRAARAGKTYDLIMLDAYDHEYIPEHMLTQEFLRAPKMVQIGRRANPADTAPAPLLPPTEMSPLWVASYP